jgi:hypothetical protein
MATISREKTATETLRLGGDFASALLSGETITAGNITVTAKNARTDSDTTTTVVASGSAELVGDVIRARFTGGTVGDIHRITFATGTTNYANKYEATFNLIITNVPELDNLLSERPELKRKLRITDSSDDQLLDELLASSTAYIRRRTGREFTLRTYTEDVILSDLHSRTHARVDNWPLIKVDQIVLKAFDGTASDTITDTSLFKWDFTPDGWIFFTDGTVFHRWPETNEITYRAGYATIPRDVREACRSLAAIFYRQIGKEGIDSERIGDYAYRAKRFDEFPPSLRREIADPFIEGVITRYKRGDFAQA